MYVIPFSSMRVGACFSLGTDPWGYSGMRLDRAQDVGKSHRSGAMKEERERVARLFFSFCSSFLRVNEFLISIQACA